MRSWADMTDAEMNIDTRGEDPEQFFPPAEQLSTSAENVLAEEMEHQEEVETSGIRVVDHEEKGGLYSRSGSSAASTPQTGQLLAGAAGSSTADIKAILMLMASKKFMSRSLRYEHDR
eukprot:g18151.t1